MYEANTVVVTHVPFPWPSALWAWVRLRACTTQVKHEPNCPEKDATRGAFHHGQLGVGGYRVQPPWSPVGQVWSMFHTSTQMSPVQLGPSCPPWWLAQLGLASLSHPPTILSGISAHISYSPLDSCLGVCLGYHGLIPSARAVKSNMNSVLTRNTGEAGPQGTDWGWPCVSWSFTPHGARNPPTSSVSKSPDSEGCVLAPATYCQVTHPLWFQLPCLGLEIKLILISEGCCTEWMKNIIKGLG